MKIKIWAGTTGTGTHLSVIYVIFIYMRISYALRAVLYIGKENANLAKPKHRAYN